MDITTINPLDLPSVALEDRSILPDCAGIYFAYTTETMLYIGQAQRLVGRWKGVAHHRYLQLKEIGGVRLAWLVVSDKSLLNDIESACIKHFSPALNKGVHPIEILGVERKLNFCVNKVPGDVLEQVKRLAEQERRSISNMFVVLVIEAMQSRQSRQARTGVEPGNFAPELLATA